MPEMPSGADEERKGWGAWIRKDGRAEFRVWAPGPEWMGLVVGEQLHSMEIQEDGWHGLIIDSVEPGTSYRFRLPSGQEVPDPASRRQLRDVHGPSVLIDHDSHVWQNDGFRGRPWHETVILEIHVGTFTPEGTFRAAIEKLPELAAVGYTAIEIMPLSHFRGERGWGYDGVLPYAPHTAYGTPEDLKALVDAAHGLGMMVFLDVVYNHFGPEGNYLHQYAPEFFSSDEPTPWGEAINFHLPSVRRYFIDNACMWIDDYRFDGLRFDATEQIRDESEEHFLEEISRMLRERFHDRYLHLISEDQRCRKAFLVRDRGNQPRVFTATWADSLHHSLHVRVTGEGVGHYRQVADDNWQKLSRATAVGLLRPEGDDPVPADAFINFLQNHDQIGNRAYGNRLNTMIDPRLMDTLTAMMMLIPQVPMMFQGEDYGETNPFCFFADFTGELARAMQENRVTEAENFGGMPKGKTLKDLPDCMDPETFRSSKLDWQHADTEEGRRRRALVRDLIALRRQHVAPLLAKGAPVQGRLIDAPDGVLAVDWDFPDGTLALRMNLTDTPQHLPGVTGSVIYATDGAGHIDGHTLSDMPAPGIAVAVNRWEAAP